MSKTQPPMIDGPEGLTTEWIGTVFGTAPSSVEVEPVGTGQMADSYRVRISGTSEMSSVVVKLPAPEVASSTTAGAYANEVNYYVDLDASLAVRTPICHHAEFDAETGRFVLVLEDLAPAKQGDQIAGCDVDQAVEAVVNLAGLHGPRWCDPTLADIEWLSSTTPEAAEFLGAFMVDATAGFIDRYRDRIGPDDVEVLDAFATTIGPWTLGRAERYTVTHGDYRLDNLLFATPDGGHPVATVDWQTVGIGLGGRDLAYFCGNSLTVDLRRRIERRLVEAYHEALVGHGVAGYDLDTCWDDYRYGQFQGPMITVLGAMTATRTDRGDDMFMAMLSRSAQAIRDLDATDLLC